MIIAVDVQEKQNANAGRTIDPSVKTVLAISYVFPPAAYVGVYRILKYCKYLGAHGWRPIVIAPRPPDRYRDDKLSQEIPIDVEVFRTADVDPAKLLRRMNGRKRQPEQRNSGAPAGSAPPAARAPHPGLLSRVKRFVLGLLLESPDSHVFWLPTAVLHGTWVLLTRNVDVIYSSSPPHSSHLAAFVLAKSFRKPYVLDFRDPWEMGGPAKALMFRLKQLVISHAACVVTVSNGEREELLQELPALDPNRVAVITNGYDPDDFALLRPATRNGSKLRISHVGTIHRDAGGEFFDALLLLLREDPGLARWLEVTLVGEVGPQYAASVEHLERTGVVSRTGFVPHSAALQHAMSSDVLLILLGGDRFAPSELPAKLSEYLYIGKPILAIAKKGELWEVLSRSGAGFAVPPHDASAVANAITRLARELRSDGHAYEPDRHYIARFDRRTLAARFAAVLDEVSGAAG
jgi:glycosyltransferase involved in cell wall biosynthesis